MLPVFYANSMKGRVRSVYSVMGITKRPSLFSVRLLVIKKIKSGNLLWDGRGNYYDPNSLAPVSIPLLSISQTQ